MFVVASLLLSGNKPPPAQYHQANFKICINGRLSGRLVGDAKSLWVRRPPAYWPTDPPFALYLLSLSFHLTQNQGSHAASDMLRKYDGNQTNLSSCDSEKSSVLGTRTGSRRGRRGSIGTIGSGKFNEASSLPCSSTGAEAGPAAGSVDRMRGSGHAQLSRSSGKRRGLALDGEKRGGRISDKARKDERTFKASNLQLGRKDVERRRSAEIFSTTIQENMSYVKSLSATQSSSGTIRLTSDRGSFKIQLLRCGKRATVICAWGENGAIAYQDQVGVVKAPSYPPDEIVDTLGAGDTFLAATIFYLSRGKSLQESIDFGCRIAGAKVGARGYDIVEKAYNQLERKPS
ncbi:unnamed protein product [Nesidiocoris tenuis]|uniref:Carbohydrate kinase PfkB domain-containing protein n=1 Tax=Nesidiocoris tenuis TaxID=355587 RepID=A0A6H5FUM2_9HEMI|nr:unnamed protein product [Nesidiocoris tenuis]